MPSRTCPDLRSPSEMESDRLYHELTGPNRNEFQWDDVVITSVPNLLCFDDSKAILLNSFNFNQAKYILNRMYSSAPPVVGQSMTDGDIVADSQYLKLDDPITLTKLKLPSRGLYCQHMQCFDFDSYLFVNKRKPKCEYLCPICSECCNPGNVYVDYITLCFLHLFKDENVEDLPTIVVMSNGTYKLSQNSKTHYINNIPKSVKNDSRLNTIIEKYGEKISLADLSKPTLDDVLNQINKSEDTLLQSLVRQVHPTINIAAGIVNKRPFYASTLQGLRHDIQGLSNGVGPCKAQNVISSLVTHVWKIKAEFVALIPGANSDATCPSTETATSIASVELANRDLCDLNTITSSVSFPVFVSSLMLYGIADTTTVPRLGRKRSINEIENNNNTSMTNIGTRHVSSTTSNVVTADDDATREPKRQKKSRSRSQSMTENAKEGAIISEKEKKAHKKTRNDNQIITNNIESNNTSVLVQEDTQPSNKARSRSQSLKDSADLAETNEESNKEKKSHKKSRSKNEQQPEAVATELPVADDSEKKTSKKGRSRSSGSLGDALEVIDVTGMDAVEAGKSSRNGSSKSLHKAEKIEVIDLNEPPVIPEEDINGRENKAHGNMNVEASEDNIEADKKERKKERKRSRSHSLVESLTAPDINTKQADVASSVSMKIVQVEGIALTSNDALVTAPPYKTTDSSKKQESKSTEFKVPPNPPPTLSVPVKPPSNTNPPPPTMPVKPSSSTNHPPTMPVKPPSNTNPPPPTMPVKPPSNTNPPPTMPVRPPSNTNHPPTMPVRPPSNTNPPPTMPLRPPSNTNPPLTLSMPANPSSSTNPPPPLTIPTTKVASNFSRQKPIPQVISEGTSQLFTSIVQAFIREL